MHNKTGRVAVYGGRVLWHVFMFTGFTESWVYMYVAIVTNTSLMQFYYTDSTCTVNELLI